MPAVRGDASRRIVIVFGVLAIAIAFATVWAATHLGPIEPRTGAGPTCVVSGTLDDCEAHCRRGDLVSCLAVAEALAESHPDRALAARRRACALGHPQSCAASRAAPGAR